MNLKKCLIGALTATLAFSSLASTTLSERSDLASNPYFQIKSMKVEEIQSTAVSNKTNPLHSIFVGGGELGQVLAVADQLIAFGEKIYDIVKKGKPVVNLTWAPVSVLPREAGKEIDPLDLEDWAFPKSKKYRITYVNGFNKNVVDFTYSVNFSYGGSYNGKGRYLTAAEIVPENVSVAWGFTFDASMKLVGVMNRGKKTNPLAAAILQISYNVSSNLKEDRNNVSYFIQGDGQMGQM
ncbi:MAG: hypothetical protein ACOYL6_14035 [Bacteriovoracaceae bacterium]